MGSGVSGRNGWGGEVHGKVFGKRYSDSTNFGAEPMHACMHACMHVNSQLQGGAVGCADTRASICTHMHVLGSRPDRPATPMNLSHALCNTKDAQLVSMLRTIIAMLTGAATIDELWCVWGMVVDIAM